MTKGVGVVCSSRYSLVSRFSAFLDAIYGKVALAGESPIYEKRKSGAEESNLLYDFATDNFSG